MIGGHSCIIVPVTLPNPTNPGDRYRVSTEVFEGPLDLLLLLIERAELDITRLALAQVTDQYLEYLQNLEDRHPDEVSAFLVIAARLVLIKSLALLPRPQETELAPEEEDPGEALAQQLIQYRRFKRIALYLDEKQTAGLHTFLRVAPLPFKVEPKLDLSDLTVQDLLQAAQQVFSKNGGLTTDLSKVVTLPRVTIREKIQSILDILRRASSASFQQLARSNTRMEIVVTFLALLELVKRHVVDAQQESLFGDISLQTSGEWNETLEDADLEFQD